MMRKHLSHSIHTWIRSTPFDRGHEMTLMFEWHTQLNEKNPEWNEKLNSARNDANVNEWNQMKAIFSDDFAGNHTKRSFDLFFIAWQKKIVQL